MSDNSQDNSDINDNHNAEGEESQAKTDIVKDLESQVESMRNKMQELLTEAKTAKQKAKEEAAAKEQAKLDRARKEGDFEKLLKSSESERNRLSEELQNLRNSINSEKINNQSMKLATELADGHNAEILSEFIAKRLKMTDDGMKVLDTDGNLTVSNIEALKVEFQNNEKYKALIRGTKASGGSSQGSGSSAATTKTVTRSELDKMNPAKRMEHFKKGGKVIDD